MNVIFSEYFKCEFQYFDENLQLAVNAFVFHLKKHGFKNLKGRNKPSMPTHIQTKKQQAQAKFAQKYCLWHYHIGIPEYIQQNNGDLTSEYILHYMYYDELIVLVDIDTHPPFKLPDVDKLNYQLF